jgi:hypothetical protein
MGPLDQARLRQVLDALLLTVGAARLTELLAESAHTHADYLAMAERAPDALTCRRHARVLLRTTRELNSAVVSPAAIEMLPAQQRQTTDKGTTMRAGERD